MGSYCTFCLTVLSTKDVFFIKIVKCQNSFSRKDQTIRADCRHFNSECMPECGLTWGLMEQNQANKMSELGEKCVAPKSEKVRPLKPPWLPLGAECWKSLNL